MIVLGLATVVGALTAAYLYLLKTKGFEYIILHYRWIFVCLFLLPASAVYDVLFFLRNRIIFLLRSAPEQHDKRVKDVQDQVRRWNEGGRQKKMCTARPGWLTISFRTPLYKDSLNAIRINLMDILEVNTEKSFVRVEPLVTMGQITATLNPLGFTLPVVPELDDLTVGGLIMGVGIETSSHIYGLFSETVRAVELVLHDGSLVRCSDEENVDLFRAIPWSHGTLGFLVAAEINILPAKKYVRLCYYPTYTMEEGCKLFAEKCAERDANHFVESLVFSRDQAVVMTGNMTDVAEKDKINPIGHFWKPWFYTHVQSFLQKDCPPVVEYIPLRHYYHRHTKSIFWMLENIIPFGNNPIFRHLFGWMVPPKVSLLKLTQGETIRRLYEERQMIQDLLVPMDDLQESLEFFDAKVDIYPLWLCPFWLPSKAGFVHPADSSAKGAMYVDIGAYGEPKRKDYHFRSTTRAVEEFVRRHSGFQMLYADSYMTEEEFRQMFDHTLIDQTRAKLNCHDAFPSVYEKVNRNARL